MEFDFKLEKYKLSPWKHPKITLQIFFIVLEKGKMWGDKLRLSSDKLNI